MEEIEDLRARGGRTEKRMDAINASWRYFEKFMESYTVPSEERDNTKLNPKNFTDSRLPTAISTFLHLLASAQSEGEAMKVIYMI